MYSITILSTLLYEEIIFGRINDSDVLLYDF